MARVRFVEDRMYVGDFGYNRVQIYHKEAYPLTAAQIMPRPGKSPRWRRPDWGHPGPLSTRAGSHWVR